jgi:hypothetical protein
MNHIFRFMLSILASIFTCLISIFLFWDIQVSAAPLSPEDAGEYIFAASSSTYTEISGGTLSTATDDDGAEDIQLPFVFYYDSLAYSTARISVNGWLELGQFFTGAGYANDLADPESRPLLAPFWTICMMTPPARCDTRLRIKSRPGFYRPMERNPLGRLNRSAAEFPGAVV